MAIASRATAVAMAYIAVAAVGDEATELQIQDAKDTEQQDRHQELTTIGLALSHLHDGRLVEL